MGTQDVASTPADLLRWDHTIDRRLVHRNAIAEVLLTDVRQLNPDEFAVAAQWPRSHRVYRPDRDGRHDPMLALESIRQAGLALSHVGYAVPFGQQALMRDINLELDPTMEPRALHAASNVAMTVSCTDVVLRSGALRGMALSVRFAVDGVEFARGGGTIGWVSQRRYEALRSRSLPTGEQLSPAAEPAGRDTRRAAPNRAAEDVLLAAGRRGSADRELVIPTDHPVYFDHPLDHAPGMVLIDAAWQAAAQYRRGGGRLVECAMACPEFTELGVTTRIKLAATSADVTRFEVEQHGRATAIGMLRLAG